MKRKFIILIVWLFLTGLYCWNLLETGKSMGATTTSAIEDYTEMWIKYQGKDETAENVTGALYEAWHYSNSDNLEEKYKGYLMAVGVTSVIYVVITVLCYHLAFIRIIDKNKE